MPCFIISSWQVLTHSRRHLLPFLFWRWCYLIAQGGHSFQAPLLTVGSQRRFITWESPLFQLTLLMLGARTNSSQGSSSLSGFLSRSNSQDCNRACCFYCCFYFLYSERQEPWPSRLAVPDKKLSHCLDVNVLLLFDRSQRWLSKAKVHSVLCSCGGNLCFPGNSPCLQLGVQSRGIKGREIFYMEICHTSPDMVVGFLQCLVVVHGRDGRC